jgi:hypothetical protein
VFNKISIQDMLDEMKEEFFHSKFNERSGFDIDDYADDDDYADVDDDDNTISHSEITKEINENFFIKYILSNETYTGILMNNILKYLYIRNWNIFRLIYPFLQKIATPGSSKNTDRVDIFNVIPEIFEINGIYDDFMVPFNKYLQNVPYKFFPGILTKPSKTYYNIGRTYVIYDRIIFKYEDLIKYIKPEYYDYRISIIGIISDIYLYVNNQIKKYNYFNNIITKFFALSDTNSLDDFFILDGQYMEFGKHYAVTKYPTEVFRFDVSKLYKIKGSHFFVNNDDMQNFINQYKDEQDWNNQDINEQDWNNHNTDEQDWNNHDTDDEQDWNNHDTDDEQDWNNHDTDDEQDWNNHDTDDE